MLVSYNWLNRYFDGKLPPPEEVAEAFTFHAWEIEAVEKVVDDTVFDVKVLPDKAMWALSHRGVAKDLSVILNLPLLADPLLSAPRPITAPAKTPIILETDVCRRFAAARIDGVKVGTSPKWLQEALTALGQRSINNIVDASNYVMFDLGQPSHAFDASLVGEGGFKVRPALTGEKLVGLDEIEYVFDQSDTLITRGDTDEILSIAGLKGGQHSGISDNTTSVIIEVANWDPVAIRKTGQRLKLRTDASSRYENGIVPEMVSYGLAAVAELIVEIAGGEVTGFDETIVTTTEPRAVKLSLTHLNSVLGLELSAEEVTDIVSRFGWDQQMVEGELTIKSPFERTDLKIAEDVIEEIGRVHGYQHVVPIVPDKYPLAEINQRFYYSEIIRQTLIDLGFSEIYTSSFREKDEIRLANAFAADKGYLRSSLRINMSEALTKNAPQADLLGLRQIRLFEIGTVFKSTGENLMLAIGVRSPGGYKSKTDDPTLERATKALLEALGVEIDLVGSDGIAEMDLGAILASLPMATKYTERTSLPDVAYKQFSVYPSVSRDIAMWAPVGTTTTEIETLLKEQAGDLCARITLFDQFEKDGRVSYAYRLAFQSKEKTLAGSEVDSTMNEIYQALSERGFKVR